MKAQEFDKKFDEGKEDIIDDLDLASARRVNQEQKRINVDFPSWVVESLDREAARISGSPKVWLNSHISTMLLVCRRQILNGMRLKILRIKKSTGFPLKKPNMLSWIKIV